MPSPVLLCTDGSDLSIAALRAGIDLIGSDHDFAVVVAMDQPDPIWVTGTGMAGSVMSPQEYDTEQAAMEAHAHAVAESTMASLGLPHATKQVVNGSPGPAICDLATELGAEAIVLGSRGRGGIKRAVLGSVSDHVLRNAPCPVVVTAAKATEGT